MRNQVYYEIWWLAIILRNHYSGFQKHFFQCILETGKKKKSTRNCVSVHPFGTWFYLGHFQSCFFPNLILNRSGTSSTASRPAGNVLWDGVKVCTSKCDSKKLFWPKCTLVINPTVNSYHEFPLLGISVASAKHNMLFLKWEAWHLANQAPCRWTAIAWYLELCLSYCIQPIQRSNKSWLWPEEPSCIDFLSWFKAHTHTLTHSAWFAKGNLYVGKYISSLSSTVPAAIWEARVRKIKWDNVPNVLERFLTWIPLLHLNWVLPLTRQTFSFNCIGPGGTVV